MDHEQIELAVVIEIEPPRGNRPLGAANANPFGHVLERSVAAVVIQRVVIDTRHKDVRMAVVVVIGYGYAHRITLARHASLLRNVCEVHVAVVAIQAIPVLRRVFLQRRNGGGIRKVDVRPSVAVVIEDRDSAGHRLDHVFLRRWMVFQDKSNAGRGRDVGELNRRMIVGGSKERCNKGDACNSGHSH